MFLMFLGFNLMLIFEKMQSIYFFQKQLFGSFIVFLHKFNFSLALSKPFAILSEQHSGSTVLSLPPTPIMQLPA